MPKKNAAAKLESLDATEEVNLRVVGKETVLHDLGGVQPNSWNPNKMTPFMRESLKHGLKTDGWLMSQALLIWRTDEKDRPKNIIIDGEHRWETARELGFEQGPMVFLDGLTEAQAKSLTIKMNQKRGEFDPNDLGALLREIQGGDVQEFALDMGIESEAMMSFLAVPPETIGNAAPPPEAGPPPGEVSGGMSAHVKQVPLFFNHEGFDEFDGHVKKLGGEWKLKTKEQIVMEALRRAARPAKKPRS